MDFVTFLYLAAAEMLLMVGLFGMFTVYRRQTRPTFPINPERNPAIAAEQYSLLLQEEINRASQRLFHLKEADGDYSEDIALIEFRIAYLKTEKQAIDQHAYDEIGLWSHLSRELQPLTGASNPTGSDDCDQQANRPDSDSQQEIDMLRRKLQAYATRVENLQKFKELFFELKKQFTETQQRNEELHNEFERLLPDNNEHEDIRDVLTKLRSENDNLHQQLNSLEGVFSSLPTINTMRDISPPTDNITESVTRIKSIITQQEARIAELSHELNSLHIELEAQERLKLKIQKLDDETRKLKDSAHHLEEENLFLQEQISVLLRQELERDEKHKRRLLQLEEDLTQQQLNFAELEKKYTSLEREYLQIYEENRRLKP